MCTKTRDFLFPFPPPTTWQYTVNPLTKGIAEEGVSEVESISSNVRFKIEKGKQTKSKRK